MPLTTPTPRSRQRANMAQAYRARGKRNGNLWLVYSPKTQRDWTLTSDRKLIHWIHYLETNSNVISFDLAPDLTEERVDGSNQIAEVDAVVTLKDSSVEWHCIRSQDHDVADNLLTPSNAVAIQGIKYRIFTDKELSPHVSTSIRWLKAISYAASIRTRVYAHTEINVWEAIKKQKGGLVENLLIDLVGHEEQEVLGVLVRLSIAGKVWFDLSRSGYGPRTPWAIITQE